MKKLRLIRPRVNDVEVVNDLRGIGNDPLLHHSFPFSALTVRGLTRDELSPILHEYDLVRRDTHEQRTHVVTVARINEGEHKLQAVTLFVAALRLHQTSLTVTSRLELLSPLHQMMHRRITSGEPVGAHAVFPAGWKEWRSSELRIALGPPIQLFLRQAGFEITIESKLHFLSDAQVKHLIHSYQTFSRPPLRTAVKR